MTGTDGNGDYHICKVDFAEDGDAPIYTTLRWGYRDEESAIKELVSVSKAENISSDDLVVIKTLFSNDAHS